MARSLWICPRRAGPAAEERQEDDQGRQADRKTDGRGGWVGETRGHYGAGTSPAGALAHLPCCHTKGDTIRVGLKDGGGKGEGHGFFFCFFFFFFFLGGMLSPPMARHGRPDVWRMGEWEVD